MAREASIKNLTNAKRAKNDEFYTQYIDIQKEIEKYLDYDPNTFRAKVVYCNCDDPFESNFFRYFVLNFNKLGLKQLITTDLQNRLKFQNGYSREKLEHFEGSRSRSGRGLCAHRPFGSKSLRLERGGAG